MPTHENNSGATANEWKQLTLVKADQRWVFRYCPGEEAELMSMLADAARDPASPLDWFDAAVLSHQMGVELQQRLDDQTDTTPETNA